MRNNKTLDIVRGGLLTALGLIFIYIASLLPTNKLFFAGIASLIIPVCILLSGVKYSVLVYAATSILGMILPGSKGVLVSYVLFFGIYGIVKYYIEKLRSIPYEIFLKLIFFNAALYLSFFIYKLLFVNLPPLKLSIWLILAGLQAVFLVYDYAVTRFIYMIDKYINKSA